MRGFLECLYRTTPFDTGFDLTGKDGIFTLTLPNNKGPTFVNNVKKVISDVLLGKKSVLSIMSFFVPESLQTSLSEELKHIRYFPCDNNWLPNEAFQLLTLKL
jgi:hypothetical protein